MKSKKNKQPLSKQRLFIGADDETRTHDLILTKDVRYHLCHISILSLRELYYNNTSSDILQALFTKKLIFVIYVKNRSFFRNKYVHILKRLRQN